MRSMLNKNSCGRAASLFECQAAGSPRVPAMHQSPSGVNVVPGNQQSGSRIAIDVIGPALVPHYVIICRQLVIPPASCGLLGRKDKQARPRQILKSMFLYRRIAILAPQYKAAWLLVCCTLTCVEAKERLRLIMSSDAKAPRLQN
jgi:hypothetical protein